MFEFRFGDKLILTRNVLTASETNVETLCSGPQPAGV